MPVLATSLTPNALADYVGRQIAAFFPDRDESNAVRTVMDDALARVEHCFSHVRIKGFWSATGPQFNHLHTDQYAIFLYYLANTAFRQGELSIAAKCYALNKALHALDAFYEVELPAIFALVHPVGTVLGRATYGDYFCAYQNVSVGANLSDVHPVIGTGVVMYGGSRVIGAVRVGDNCFVSAGVALLGGDVPTNHIAFGGHPPVVKPTKRNVRREIFKDV